MRVGINRRAVGWIAAAALGGGVAPAMAQSGALQWHCWVDGGERLRCVLDVVQADARESAVLGTPAMTGLAPPLPSPSPLPANRATVARSLPPIVAQLRAQPQALAGQVIAIPLYSVTDDWPRVTQLARAVLCTSSLPCTIRLSTSLNEALSQGLDTDRLFVGPDLGSIARTSMR
ncbi:MAG: hypothetical protein IPM01_24485 [Burkholderiaceae bacterium]|nr:hypothetical protein [Burkholderiaceae bacterium]